MQKRDMNPRPSTLDTNIKMIGAGLVLALLCVGAAIFDVKVRTVQTDTNNVYIGFSTNAVQANVGNNSLPPPTNLVVHGAGQLANTNLATDGGPQNSPVRSLRGAGWREDIGQSANATVSEQLILSQLPSWLPKSTYRIGFNTDSTLSMGLNLVSYNGLYLHPNLVLGETGFDLSPSDKSGFYYLPSMSGTPTSVPYSEGTYQVPFTYDRAGNKMYVYNSGWKSVGGSGGSDALWDTSSFVFTNILVSNMTAGTNDIFTVPSGQRFALIGLYVGTTNTVNSGANFSLVKTNGSYWKLASNSSLSVANPIAFAANMSSFIYDNNESVAVFAGQNGFSCWCSGFLFTNTLHYFSLKAYNVAAGTNTFYTAPSGKLATSAALLIAPLGSSTATFGLANDTSVTTHLWLVPNGGSRGDPNYFRSLTSGGAVTPHAFLFLPAWMQAGDTLAVGTTATTGLIYLTVFEK